MWRWLIGVGVGIVAVLVWMSPQPVAAWSCDLKDKPPGTWWQTTDFISDDPDRILKERGNRSYAAFLKERNEDGPYCTTWWGWWRRPPVGVARSVGPSSAPSGHQVRVAQTQWPAAIDGITIPAPPRDLYSAGEWYETYEPKGMGYRDVFRHMDDHSWVEPQPTPTPTSIPAPRPGTMTVVVVACGNNPFGTQITRREILGVPGYENAESREAVSNATFTVPEGHDVTFVAAGYGSFADTEATGRAGQTLTIQMNQIGTPCAPQPTATLAPPPTPIPQCSGAQSAERLEALTLMTPVGTREQPLQVPAGALALAWNRHAHFGDETALAGLTIFDVTGGARQQIRSYAWERAFQNDQPTSRLFLIKTVGNLGDLVTNHPNHTAWSLDNGTINFSTPPLVAGHTYEIFANYSAHTAFCGVYSTSGFVTVASADIAISVRHATLDGIDHGPIVERPLTVNDVVKGQTTENGTNRYILPTDAATNPVRIGVVTPAKEFTWTITGSCLENEGVTVDLEKSAVFGLATGGCNLVWTQIVIPTISARAFFRNATVGDYQELTDGSLHLVASDGTQIASQPIRGGNGTVMPLTGGLLRSLVATIPGPWALSYTAPSSIWNQTTPRAGSGGDSIAGDLALTFPVADSTDNRFFIERDSSIALNTLTLRGTVRLINLDGSTQTGPYGTVKAKWSVYSEKRVSVAADGSWEIQITNLAYSPTIELSFEKNLATAVYDHAEIGTINGQPVGEVSAPNHIQNINISNDGLGEGYNFVLRESPPPPPPPVASGELRIWIHSHLDPEQGVYKSENQTISWPHAEILDVAPAVDLAPLPAAPAGYRYEQRVVAWAYDGSIGYAARDVDAFKRDGCRKGAKPNDAGDLSLLSGCVYGYHEAPTPAQMNEQARVWWSMVLPPAMVEGVYSYKLPRFESVNVQLSALVETATVSTVTGQRWTQRQAMPGTFKVKLVAPRTLK